MKKYNLSKIMKRAWELVKGFGFAISEGLKKAWKEAKEVKKASMRGSEKQIKWATELLEKMHNEFAACKKIAPANVHPMFDKIENILSESYAGDVIDLLMYKKSEGQRYFIEVRCAINASGCDAAMKIKKEFGR